MALPGKYQVRLTSGGKTQTAPFELRLDPRVKVSAEDLQKQFDLRIQIGTAQPLADAVAQIDDVRAQAEGLSVRLADGPDNDAIRKSASDLDQKLLKARDEVIEKRILPMKTPWLIPLASIFDWRDWPIASAMTAILLLRNPARISLKS